jgi:hypothetical protein
MAIRYLHYSSFITKHPKLISLIQLGFPNVKKELSFSSAEVSMRVTRNVIISPTAKQLLTTNVSYRPLHL